MRESGKTVKMERKAALVLAFMIWGALLFLPQASVFAANSVRANTLGGIYDIVLDNNGVPTSANLIYGDTERYKLLLAIQAIRASSISQELIFNIHFQTR